MNSQIVSITPKQAAEWLELNVVNRKLSRNTVNRYVKDMLSGKWVLNAETIKFTRSGLLLDGQHRLNACVISGIPFESLVVFGVEEKAFETIDSGKFRSVSDTLGILGKSDTARLSSALTLLLHYEQGSIGTFRNVSSSMATEVLERHPGMEISVARTKHFPKKLRIAITSLIDYAGRQVDARATEIFLEKVRCGENMSSGDPALLLRNRLLNDTIYASSGTGRVLIVSGLFIKALNAALEGRTLGCLKHSANNEVPSILGLPYGQKIKPISAGSVVYVPPAAACRIPSGMGCS